MRVAVVHNMKVGGALRTLEQHLAHCTFEWREFRLSTAAPLADDADVTRHVVRAERVHRALRPPLRYADLLALVAAWRRVNERVNDYAPDVVLCHSCQFLQTPPLLSWTPSPTLYFCHEPRRVDYEQEAASTRNTRTRALYAPLHALERRFDRDAARSATALITNSAYTATTIRAAYGREARPVPFGVNEIFTPAQTPAPPRHVLSVGALVASKGHDLVIEAAARTTRGWPVVVVAPRADPHEEARLERAARKLDVALDLRVGISDEELRELYRTAVATCYLARREPLGLVSVEAQASGCPVIVADEGGLPETLVDGETGWAVAREADVVARRLDELAEDGARRQAMARAAAAYGGKASWARAAAAVETSLRELATTPNVPLAAAA